MSAGKPIDRPTTARRLLLAVAVGLACLIGLAGPAAGKSQAQSLYWGAQIGTQLTGAAAPWDMGPVYKFQEMTGKGLSLVEFAAPFWDCRGPKCLFIPFPSTPLENIRRYGAIPVLSWNSGTTGSALKEPRARLVRIIRGTYDRQLRKFARQAQEWGHPFFLRFDWEMNGFWFPWSEGVNRNRQGQFVKAWRHVHRIFSAEGATNATWVWCPNVNISGQLQNLPLLYPGSRFVDWTCLDGYNWGLRRGSPGWLSFEQIYRSTYREITGSIAPHKPMMLAELASTDRGGSKPAWIRNMLHRVRTSYRKVGAIAWFDQEERHTHWPIESSAASLRAFSSGIANPAFRPNEFDALPPARIFPP